MKKKGISSIKTKFTREELLGEGNYFHLDQSEYICKKIIDQILFLTFQQVRFDNVKEMQYDYSAYTTILNLQSIVNLGLIRPEIEYEKEINYEINFDIKPSIIDSWASNKAKMLNKCEPKEIPIAPQKKEQISQISPKKNVPRELPMEAYNLDIEEKENLNEIEQMKIKGFRAYFAEKEIENQKRKIIEMEQAERAKEEQKKVKQVMELINSSNLVSWDSEGRFLPIKYIKESEMKNFPEAKSQINENEINYDTDKLYNLDKNGNQKIPKDILISYLPIQIEERKEKFYQPNPLKSHSISKGIVMDFYGIKKDGGEFDKGDGRLTLHQFFDQMALIRPNDLGYIDNANNNNNDNLDKIEEKDDENTIKKKDTGNRKSIPNFTRLYYLFREEMNSKSTFEKGKNLVDILKKKKKVYNSKYGMKNEIEGKIEENSKLKLKLNDIKDFDDQNVYNDLKNSGPEIVLGNNKFVGSVLPQKKENQDFKSSRNRNIKRNIRSAQDNRKKFLPKSVIKAIDKEKNEKEDKNSLPEIKNKKFTGKGIYDSNLNKE